MWLQQKGHFSRPGQKGRSLSTTRGSTCARACLQVHLVWKQLHFYCSVLGSSPFIVKHSGLKRATRRPSWLPLGSQALYELPPGPRDAVCMWEDFIVKGHDRVYVDNVGGGLVQSLRVVVVYLLRFSATQALFVFHCAVNWAFIFLGGRSSLRRCHYAPGVTL